MGKRLKQFEADAISRLKIFQNDDECNLVDYPSPSLDDFCLLFAKQKRISCERDEMTKRMIRRVMDGDGKHVSNVFKRATGFLTKVENGMLHNGARP